MTALIHIDFYSMWDMHMTSTHFWTTMTGTTAISLLVSLFASVSPWIENTLALYLQDYLVSVIPSVKNICGDHAHSLDLLFCYSMFISLSPSVTLWSLTLSLLLPPLMLLKWSASLMASKEMYKVEWIYRLYSTIQENSLSIQSLSLHIQSHMSLTPLDIINLPSKFSPWKNHY